MYPQTHLVSYPSHFLNRYYSVLCFSLHLWSSSWPETHAFLFLHENASDSAASFISTIIYISLKCSPINEWHNKYGRECYKQCPFITRTNSVCWQNWILHPRWIGLEKYLGPDLVRTCTRSKWDKVTQQ